MALHRRGGRCKLQTECIDSLYILGVNRSWVVAAGGVILRVLDNVEGLSLEVTLLCVEVIAGVESVCGLGGSVCTRGGCVFWGSV